MLVVCIIQTIESEDNIYKTFSTLFMRKYRACSRR